MLHHRRLAAADRQHAFSHPSDRRPECHAVEADFSFGAEVFHRCPDGIVIDLLHADVVELHDVDAPGTEALEGGICCSAKVGGREVLGNLALAAPSIAMVYEIVADLGGDHDVIESACEGFCDEVLAAAVAIGVGGIEERDAFVARRVHEAHRLLVCVVAPPSGRERPETKTHLADLEVRAAELTIFHTL